VARAAAREERANLVGLIGVIHNHQPAWMLLKPTPHRVNCDLWVGGSYLLKGEKTSYFSVSTRNLLQTVRTQPKYRVIFVSIPIRVFDRDLSFPDSPKTRDSLGNAGYAAFRNVLP
jgi:hypothetical protein